MLKYILVLLIMLLMGISFGQNATIIKTVNSNCELELRLSCGHAPIDFTFSNSSNVTFTPMTNPPDGGMLGSPAQAIVVTSCTGPTSLTINYDRWGCPSVGPGNPGTVSTTVSPSDFGSPTITGSTASLCENQTRSFSGSPGGGTWSVTSGGGSITSGGTYNPPNISSSRTITIRYTAPSTCYEEVSFTLVPEVASPTSVSASPTTGCSGYTSNLSANCSSGSVRWYTSPTGTGAGISDPYTVTANTTVYARCYNGAGFPTGCQYSSASSGINLTISAPPIAPGSVSASPTTGCSGYSSNLSATCLTGSVRWYTSPTGTGAGVSDPYTVSSNTTLYARCYNSSNPSGCQYGPASSGVSLTIGTTPPSPTSVSASPTTGCSGYSSNLSANCATGTVRWYTSPTGTGTGVSDPYTVSSNTTLYARCYNSSNPSGCQYGSASSGVSLTVASPPSSPTGLSASPSTGCSGYTTTLSGSCATGTLRWYTSATGTGAGISNSQSVSAPGNTFYARCFNGSNPAGCQYSSANSVAVTASAGTPAPSAVSASPNNGCAPYTSTLSATCATGTLRWYTSATGTGAGISNSQSISAPGATFYARCYDNSAPAGCQYGAAVSVPLTAFDAPSGPTAPSASTTSGCIPFSTTLSATCATGTLRWYTSATGTGAGVGNNPTISSTGSTNYFARCYNSAAPAGCQYGTASSAIAVTGFDTPNAPTAVSASPSTGCSGYTTTLSGSCATGTLRWYTSATGTGAGISNSQSVSAPGNTFYARCFNGSNPAGCQYSSANSVAVTASAGTPAPSAVSASPNNGCAPYTSTLSATCATGTLRWYTSATGTGAGISNSQSISAPGATFYARCYDNSAPAGCQYGAAVSVALTAFDAPSGPTAPSASTTSGCIPFSTTLSATCATGTLRWYTSATGTGAGVGNNPTISSTGSTNYFARCYNSAAPAGCQYGTASSAIAVTGFDNPNAPTGITTSNNNLCAGYSTNLSGSCATGTLRWYSSATGTGTGLSMPYTVNSNQTVYARCFESGNAAACQYSTANSINLTVSASPNAPTALTSSQSNGCVSYTTNLSGNCSGAGSLRWYTSASATGAGLTMPVTVNATNTTFYAKCFDNSFPAGCQYSVVDSVSLSVTTPVTVNITGPSNVCVNATVSYNSSHSPGSWFIESGATSASINSTTGDLTATAIPGPVTIGYSHTNGPCLDTGYFNLNVIALPVVSLNDSMACFGNTIQLTPTVTGGTYTIVSGPGTVSPSGVFSSPSVGVTRVSYAITSGGCIGYDSANITINPIPSQVTGITASDDTICRGVSTIVSGNCGGSSIVWFDNRYGTGAPLFSGNNYSVTPLDTDTLYAFCYDSATSCQSTWSDSLIITVEICTDTITKLMPSNGCGDTTTLSITNLPGGPDFISTCSADSVTANGEVITFINDSTFSVTPSTLPYNADSACIIMCNTSIPRCDTTIMYWIPDTTMPAITPPSITCMDDTVYIGSSGSVTVTPSQVASVTYDCLLPDTTYLSQHIFGCSDTGANNIWVYATNNYGAIDSCALVITVRDTIKPTVMCQNFNAYLDASGNVSITSNDVDGGTFDNCAIFNRTVTPNTFSCANLGTNLVTLVATDVNGNIDSCSATVNVIDTIPGSITCTPSSAYISPSGTVVIDTASLVSNVNDNCSIDSVWVKSSDTLLSCLNVGNYTATIYVRDGSGNMDSCQSNVTVLDTLTPQAICTDTTIYLDTNGQFTIDSSFIDGGSFSTCRNITMSLSQSSFNCFETGNNPVTLTVQDDLGRSSSCVANVTVIDSIAPVIDCPADPQVFVEDFCDYTVPDYTASLNITDNCGSSTLVLSQSPAPGAVINATAGGTLEYDHPIIVTATDPAGNTTTCNFNINLSCNINLIIPQFISPNGDGINDQWVIDFITEYPNSSVKVFNRWGSIVYLMDNYDNSWDGKANSGYKAGYSSSGASSLPSATYFYIVDKGNGDDPYTGYMVIRK